MCRVRQRIAKVNLMLRLPSSDLQHVHDMDVAWCCATKEYFDVKE